MNSPLSKKPSQYLLRWGLSLCVIVLLGSVETEPANAADDPATASKPATLLEVRKAIDWLKFPKPGGAMWERTNLMSTHYWVPGTIAQAADFYRKSMASQGWTETKKAFADPEPEKHQSIEFAKAGFLVSLSLSGKNNNVEVRLNHLGNVDARRLPKPTDAKVANDHIGYVSYTTASKPESAAEFCRKEIIALGWRETPAPEAKSAAKEGKTILRLVQNAMQCSVTITPKKEGETEVIYHTFFRSTFDPAEVVAAFVAKEIPKPASVKEALQMLDLRKLPYLGETVPEVNNGIHAKYETRASVAKAVAFYRKTLTELGWVLVPPLEDVDASGVLHFEKTGYHLRLKFDNLIDQPNKTGLVGIEITNHGNVDFRQLPFMPGAEINYEFPDRYRVSATADSAAAFYRKELAQLGWQETSKGETGGKYGYRLSFYQNDARLRITIDTRDGQASVQLSTEFGRRR